MSHFAVCLVAKRGVNNCNVQTTVYTLVNSDGQSNRQTGRQMCGRT